MRFQNLNDWLSWQETLHPAEIDMGLERIRQVWQRLCPQVFEPVVISVAGTNGKGSCSAMLESVYRHAGYRVGCYTSPHLLRYNERIRIHGNEVEDSALCQAFAAVDQARADTSLTYFEFGTLAALTLFANAGLDLVILEVGLGGRLDAVNIIDADVALLTSVGLDHQDWLGHDRDTIGLEKAGIFRPGRPAICAEADPPASVLAYAQQTGVPTWVYGQAFSIKMDQGAWSWHGPRNQSRYGLPMPALRGDKQLQNAAAVIMVVESLSSDLPVSQDHLRQGLLDVNLAGRFQVIAGRVPVILDVAHNVEAVEVLLENLQAYACQGRLHAVLGMLHDKDAGAVAALLDPLVSHWQLCGISASRGQDVDHLAQQLQAAGVTNYELNQDVIQAFDRARASAQAGDCILVCGSFYVVADVLRQLSRSGH
jgi:dihydrofolate synthase/folylpolyglutamate synthase